MHQPDVMKHQIFYPEASNFPVLGVGLMPPISPDEKLYVPSYLVGLH